MDSDRVRIVLWGLILPVVGLAILLAADRPLTVDEALTYRHFTSQGWKIAVSVYPFPNNHVLLSLLTVVAQKLPLHPFMAMRAVSILAGLGNGLLIYRILRLHCTVNWSLAGALIWASGLAGLSFSIYARGYGLQLFFILLSFHLMQRITGDPGNRTAGSSLTLWAALSASCALGFFTIPTFLFPFCSLVLVLAFHVHRNGQRADQTGLAVFCTSTGLLTALLYSPIMYYYGIDSLIGNQWVQERKLWNLTSGRIAAFPMDIMAYIGPLIAILFCLALIFSKKGSEGKPAYWPAAFFLLPMPLMLLMRTVPFPRTFAYLSALMAIFIVLRLYGIPRLRKLRYGIALTGLIVGSLAYSASSVLNIGEDNPTEMAIALRAEALQIEDCTKIYTDGWSACGTMLDFYSWFLGEGPEVTEIHAEEFLSGLNARNGRYILIDGSGTVEGCVPIIERGPMRICDCSPTVDRLFRF